MQNRLDKLLETLISDYSLKEIQKTYEKISQAYRSYSAFTLTTELEALAYVLVRMPATVAVSNHILSLLQKSSLPIHTLLDLGSGPGSILWAFQQGFDLKSVTLVERSPSLLQMGQTLAQALDQPTSLEWKLENLSDFCPQKQYDLVTISYVLNELSEPTQRDLIQKAWETSTSYIVLIEPGTPQGFLNIQRARQQLIKSGAYIIAPCTHEKTCPLSENDWCHFKIRVDRSIVHQAIKGLLSYEEEKYSFILASKYPLTSRSRARIVKKPLHSTGLVELALCTEKGLIREKISKRSKQDYKFAKKLKWGDVF